jgi:uncharacterized SAM-binding protein YcdF (DUF218 family)
MKNFFTKIPKAYQRPLLSVFGLTCISLATWKPLAISYGKWLAAGESSPKGDMSVLLSGNNPARVETLINLYAEGNVGAVYYAAGIDETRSHLENYQRIFAKYAVPKENLYCGDSLVESTYNEAQTFKRKLAAIKPPVKTIVLVSDRYHLRRGVWSFQHIFGDDLKIKAYATPSSPEIADPEWWKYQSSRIYVLSETRKLAFYMVYYGLLGNGAIVTHGDYHEITKGKTARGVKNACQIVLPQLTGSGR